MIRTKNVGVVEVYIAASSINLYPTVYEGEYLA